MTLPDRYMQLIEASQKEKLAVLMFKRLTLSLEVRCFQSWALEARRRRQERLMADEVAARVAMEAEREQLIRVQHEVWRALDAKMATVLARQSEAKLKAAPPRPSNPPDGLTAQ